MERARDPLLDRGGRLRPRAGGRGRIRDTKGYDNLLDRSWLFRTVGYGHGAKTWRNIISVLRAVGYDYVMSIEHEDALASVDEGLSKAVRLLQEVLFAEPGRHVVGLTQI